MTKEQINAIVTKQREFFNTGETLSCDFRLKALKKLKTAIEQNQPMIEKALKSDLGKSRFEGYMCETGLTLAEITYMQRHLKNFSKEKTVYTPLAQFLSRSFVKPMPYGVTLIMSPWNYPLLLTLEPLVDALSAGNTAIIKPSAYSPETSAVIEKLIKSVFDEKYVAVVTGGRKENSMLLEEKFDYIFFTGSQAVGKEVMRHAAEHLTPMTLELGGKSPCIVDESAALKLTAKRIVFGKFLNCGQTCVAPDYILCDKKVKDELVGCIRDEITKQFGENPLDNENYGKIISEKHFNRVVGLINKDKVAIGGDYDEKALRITPTVMENVTFDDDVMGEEIFGPILPIITFDNIEKVVEIINSRQKPLALYMFSKNKKNIKLIKSRVSFGGGCINDTVIHLATSNMGFGGVGESGMGAYHGKIGFDTFSHKKSIVDKKIVIDLPMRYQPYKSKLNEKLIRFFLK